MTSPWCVLRTSLFPADFDLSTATEAERARFEAAIAFVNPALGARLRSGDPALGDTLGLYAARARDRSGPRSLFAAAAMGVEGGRGLSLKDVRVEISPSRERARQGGEEGGIGGGGEERGAGDGSRVGEGAGGEGAGGEGAGGEDPTLWVSPEVVFHAGGVARYRYNRGDRDFDLSALHMPDALRGALEAHPSGRASEWEARFVAAEIGKGEGDGALTRSLMDLGILTPRGRPILHNGGERPLTHTLEDAQARAQSLMDAQGGEGAPLGITSTGRTLTPVGTFATFAEPVALPAPLQAAQAIGEMLTRCAVPAPTGVPKVLAEWLDGRWLPLSELERYAEGLMAEGARRALKAPVDDAFVDWVRARALEETIDLSAAPLPEGTFKGHILMLTEWTQEGQLLEPLLFATPPREVMGRYDLPGLPDALATLDGAPPLLLAYHGPGAMGDLAEVYAPGVRALEYCGWGSDPALSLRLQDIEVGSTGEALVYRHRETREALQIVPATPLNESLKEIHPFVRLILGEARTGLPILQLFKRALQDYSLRPRLTYQGHILRRRRVTIPPDMTPDALPAFLAARGLGGAVNLEVSDGRLNLRPDRDDAVRRLLFKELGAGKLVRVSEGIPAGTVDVDGSPHGAHALVAITVGAPRPTPPLLGRPGPRAKAGPDALRGPFHTLRIHALADRMPKILGALRGASEGAESFYVFMGGTLDCELRFRVARGPALPRLLQRCDELLGAGRLRTWALEPYLREWDRYGGAVDIAGVEAFFVADSEALGGACAGLGARDDRRRDLYTLSLVQSLFFAGMGGEEALARCRGGVEAASREFGWGSPSRRALGASWRGRRAGVMALVEGGGDDTLRDALAARRDALTAWRAGPGSEAQLRAYLPALIHMTGTRIHLKDNRPLEGEAHFFAAHALGEWIHRGGLKAARAFLLG